MSDYKKMYLNLVDKIDKSIEILKSGLEETEEIYINDEETVVDILKVDGSQKK